MKKINKGEKKLYISLIFILQTIKAIKLHYMAYKDLDIEILKSKIHELKFICGVALYFDETASERRAEINPNLKLNNNYGVVTQNGKFLTDIQRQTMKRFYHNLRITEHGLFEMILELQDVSESSWPTRNDKVTYLNYIFDFQANFLSSSDLETVLLILSNRTRCYSQEKYYETPSYFKEVRSDIPWGYTQDDGLTPYTDEFTAPGRDHETITYHIRDEYGNNIAFEYFDKGIKMLNNGRIYLGELVKKFSSCSTFIIKSNGK